MFYLNESDNQFNSPINCIVLKVTGFYLIALFVLSILANFIVLWTFSQYKRIKNPSDLIVISISILNLVGVFLELPFVLVSSFSCR